MFSGLHWSLPLVNHSTDPSVLLYRVISRIRRNITRDSIDSPQPTSPDAQSDLRSIGVGLPAINSELMAMGKESNFGSDDWSKRSSRVDKLVQGWEKRHNIRYISYVGGWAFSAAALLSALSL